MEAHPKTLPCIAEGQTAKVASLQTKGLLRDRLLAIGLIPGTPVECVRTGSGIAAYRIKGAVVALRDCDAQSVMIV